MTTTQLLSGLRPVTLDCFSVFAPFYVERARHYVYPRYMQSVCVLVYMGRCYYNIIRATHGQVLALFKRTSIFGKVGVQMPVTPISLSGSARDEREVMQAALKVGISLRVTSEDISRYRIPRNILSDGTGPFVPVNNEYIYNAQQGMEMQGSKYRKMRYQTKRIMHTEGFVLTSGAHPQAETLVRAWDERFKRINGTVTHQASLWEVCKAALKDEAVMARNIVIGDTLQCLSVVERLAPKHSIIVQRLRNYGTGINDVGSAMQWADCSACQDNNREPVLLNMGLADTEGLIASKEGMNPCRHQKIYTVKTTKTNIILKQFFR